MAKKVCDKQDSSFRHHIIQGSRSNKTQVSIEQEQPSRQRSHEPFSRNPRESKRHSMIEDTNNATQERCMSTAERNVVNFIQSSHLPNSNAPIMRSNSYTLQDVDKQRRSIQASMEACNDHMSSVGHHLHPLAACEDDPNYRYYHSLTSVKGRRVSKSLPELNHLRHFPLVTTRYQGDNMDDPYDDEDDDEETNSRGTRDIPEKTAWGGKSEFIFTGIVLALGLNNLWRFPYFCYKFHAGSFLFAYIICMLFIGLPILSMEYALGQLTRRGPIAAFGGLCPLLKGVPIAASFIALLSAPMYSTINSWSLFYFFKSFYAIPLWSKCDNSWNNHDCSKNGTKIAFIGDRDIISNKSLSPYIEIDPYEYDDDLTNDNTSSANNHSDIIFTRSLQVMLANSSSYSSSVLGHDVDKNTSVIDDRHDHSETLPTSSIPSPDISSIFTATYSPLNLPTQQFFDNKLLELDVNSYVWGQIQWELIIFVFLTWIIVFISLRRNILFSTHPSSCFSLLPYVILLVLFIRTTMFEGAYRGVVYFLKPDWIKLTQPDIWLYSAGLSVHSVATVLGISFAKATCNRERNNFLRDAFIMSLINIATAVFIGMIVFATLGNLAHKRKVDISVVLMKDPGFAFVAFSELLSSIPFTSFWSCVFFITLFCLGVDYQISMIRSFLVAIEDAYGSHVKRNFLAHQIFTLIISVLGMLLTLIFLTQQGLLLIQAFDQYLTVVLTLILAFFQVILMGWFYGGSNLAQVIKLKISKSLGCFFPLSWNFLTPLFLIGILAWSAAFYQESLFRDNFSFPVVMHVIVVGIAIGLMLLIPFMGYYQVMKTPRHESFINRVVLACKPFEKDAPSVPLVEEEPTVSYSHNRNRQQTPPSTNRRPSILVQNWSKINLNTTSRGSASQDSVSSNQYKRVNNNSNESSNNPNERNKHDFQVIPITLSLIQGLDRETDL